jgi:hypothetical protein
MPLDVASAAPEGAGAPDRFERLRPIDWEAVEEAFRAWQARNNHALELGGTGDLVDLVSVLKAAITN